MYLDVNGDGQNTSADVLTSASTGVDVWLRTNVNADSSTAGCNSSAASLTINSYEFFLRSAGSLTYGAWTDSMGFGTSLGDLVAGADTYHGHFSLTIVPAGTYKLGRLALTGVVDGATLAIVTASPVNPPGFTSFGSGCEGNDFDNTYKLGSDWFDVSGCGAPSEGGSVPLTLGPDGFDFVRGMPVALAVEYTDRDQAGAALDVQHLPPGLIAVTGWQVDGKRQLRVYGLISESVATGTLEDIMWTASDATRTQVSRTRVAVTTDLRPLAELNARASEIVTKQYSHGLSRLESRSLGVRVLPRLAEMLRDNSYKRHWHKIITTMGVLGDTAYFDTLHAFIWDRFSGPIDWPTFMAMTTAQGSLSTMATTSPRVRAYLLATTTTTAWERLRWTFPENSPGTTAKMLWQSTLGSLCYTDNEEASAFIQQLPPGTSPAERRHAMGLRDAHQKVRQWGYVRLWRENETRLRGGRR